MKREYLARMSADELEEYARALGIDLKPAKTKKQKLEMIERRRNRSARVFALGLDFEIPIKRAHDKRVTDLLSRPERTDEETMEAMTLLLGEEQVKMLIDACTETDGTIDSDALGISFVRILFSEELKNF